MDRKIIVLGDFNMPIFPLDKCTRQNIRKGIRVLNEKLEELGLMDRYRAFHP